MQLGWVLAESRTVGAVAQVIFVKILTAQIGEISFTKDQQEGGQQRQQKLLLRFAKCPILANRACRVSIMLSLWCGLDICTLQGEIAFCLLICFFYQKTVRTIVIKLVWILDCIGQGWMKFF